MKTQLFVLGMFSLFTSLAPGTLAQDKHDGHEGAHHDHDKPDTAKTDPVQKSARTGDAYYLGTCPVSGKKLGSMGDPVIKVYEGREVRFCCPACPPKFEKDLTGNLAKLDEQITKDQLPLYPLTTSLVSGKPLPEKPFDYVYGNRLVRLGNESEKAEFMKSPDKYLADLDKAVMEKQGKNYPLENCVVSGEKLGGEMGKPVDIVVGGRLIRLCCKDCKKQIESDPAKYVAKVDAARRGEKPAEGHKHDDGKGEGEHHHGG